jgi:hypothetical protein
MSLNDLSDPLDDYEAKYLNKVRHDVKFYPIEGTEWLKSEIRQVNQIYSEFEVAHKTLVPIQQIHSNQTVKISPHFNNQANYKDNDEDFSDQDSWDELFPTSSKSKNEINSDEKSSELKNVGLNTAIIDLTSFEKNENSDDFSDNEQFELDYSHVFKTKTNPQISPETTNTLPNNYRSPSKLIGPSGSSSPIVPGNCEKLTETRSNEGNRRNSESSRSDRSGNLFDETDPFSSDQNDEIIEISDSPERPPVREIIKKQTKLQNFFRKK